MRKVKLKTPKITFTERQQDFQNLFQMIVESGESFTREADGNIRLYLNNDSCYCLLFNADGSWSVE